MQHSFDNPNSNRPLAPEIELPAADQVRQLIPAFMVQTIEQEILAVKAKCFGCYAKGYDLEVGELGYNPTPGYVSESIHTILDEILADFEDSDKIYDEVAHEQTDSGYRYSHN